MDIERYLTTLSVDDVRKILDEKITIKDETEEISVNDALTSVLSEDIVSEIDVPQFPKSRMDGYAVIAKDTFDAEEDRPIKLKVIGEVQAGHAFSGTLKEGEAIQIATGAPIPQGADAIVMVEYTERKKDEVFIYRAATPKQYVIKIGTDIKKGSIVLPKGKKINLRDLGVLSAINRKTIKIISPPTIGLFSTGDELIQQDEKLSFGKIYDINSTTLYHGVLEVGGKPTFLGILKDDYDVMKKKITENLKKFDILIISGGTSKGIGDYMPNILKDLENLDFFIHGIRIKPGKPTIITGIKRKNEYKLLIVLPGYPTSALSIFYQIVSPLIYKLRGLEPEKSKTILAKNRKRIYSEHGRREYKMVRIYQEKEIEVEAIHTGSESITTLANTDGYIIILEDTQLIEEGEKVTVHLFP